MKTKDLVIIALFAALISIGSIISIPIGPVPMTLQLPLVLLSGLLLGPKRGPLSVLVYILIGLVGLPVFAGGNGGIDTVVSPTFGFLIGFLPGSYIAGLATYKGNHNIFIQVLITIIAVLVVFIFGVSYFIFIMNFVLGTPMSLIEVVKVAVLPFVIKDLIVAIITVLFARLLLSRNIIK